MAQEQQFMTLKIPAQLGALLVSAIGSGKFTDYGPRAVVAGAQMYALIAEQVGEQTQQLQQMQANGGQQQTPSGPREAPSDA